MRSVEGLLRDADRFREAFEAQAGVRCSSPTLRLRADAAMVRALVRGIEVEVLIADREVRWRLVKPEIVSSFTDTGAVPRGRLSLRRIVGRLLAAVETFERMTTRRPAEVAVQIETRIVPVLHEGDE